MITKPSTLRNKQAKITDNYYRRKKRSIIRFQMYLLPHIVMYHVTDRSYNNN
jgi:hypothetical protein